MAELTVRAVGIDELPAACELRNEMVFELTGRYEDERHPGWRPRFLTFWGAHLRAKTGISVYVLDGARPVGMAFAYIPVTHRSEIYAEPYGYINHIYVIASYRGRGLGRAVTQHVVGWIRANGCGSARLVASEQAAALYRSMGFISVPMMELAFD
ncbi:MAG: N-acetyltransferase family protein [Vulcanimicrobiaceae bacterium]